MNTQLGTLLKLQCAIHGAQQVQLCSKADLMWRLIVPEAAQEFWPESLRWDVIAASQSAARHRLLSRAALDLSTSQDSSDSSSSIFSSLWSSFSASGSGGASSSAWPRQYSAVYDIYLADDTSTSTTAIASSTTTSSTTATTSTSTDKVLITESELAACLLHVNPLEAKPESPSLHPRTLLRFRTAATSDVIGTNKLLRHALTLTRGRRIAVEATPDRMMAIARLADSALLSPRVYPHLRLIVHRGQEIPSRMQLVMALGELASLEGITVGVELCVERPWPDLAPIFDCLTRHNRMIRLIVVTLQRTPQQMMKAATVVR